MNIYMLAWSLLRIQPSYTGACCVVVYMEVDMKKGDLVKEIKTDNFYLVVSISRLSNRSWVFVEPLCEGLCRWERAKHFEKVIRV